MSQLGDLIRQHLDTHPGTKKKDIAAAAGVSAQSVSGWLNGAKTPNLEVDSILGLAQVLRVDVKDVVLAVNADRGLPVYEEQLSPEIRVTITTTNANMRKLSPERAQMVARLAASLAEEEARQPRKRGRR